MELMSSIPGWWSVPGRFVAPDVIECTSPQITRRDISHEVALSIAERHSNYTGGNLLFTYMPDLVVTHLEPELVLLEGGEVISVFGEYHESTDAWCHFTFDSSTMMIVSAKFCRQQTHSLPSATLEQPPLEPLPPDERGDQRADGRRRA